MKAKLHNASRDLTRHQDTLLIVGDGRTMPDDVSRFRNWSVPHDIGSIGRSIKYLEYTADHWWNADGDTAIAWVKDIKTKSPNGLIAHTMGEVEGFDADWDVEQPDYHFEDITNQRGRIHGSSAMFAVLTALEMGYSKIVLAGCPMDSEGHWYFEPSKETLGPMWLANDIWAWLDFAKIENAARVKSMSGYTAKILGEVTENWIHGE